MITSYELSKELHETKTGGQTMTKLNNEDWNYYSGLAKEAIQPMASRGEYASKDDPIWVEIVEEFYREGETNENR